MPCRGPAGEGGGGCWSRVACLNFKRSRVGALSMFHAAVTVAVGNLKKGCRLSRFHFKCCRYFLGYVACWNLRWQSLLVVCDSGLNQSINQLVRKHCQSVNVFGGGLRFVSIANNEVLCSTAHRWLSWLSTGLP